MESRSTSSPSLGLLHAYRLSNQKEPKSSLRTPIPGVLESSDVVDPQHSRKRRIKSSVANGWRWLATDS
ncbi:hypothetical protein GJ744_006787 [Endocarpon pusillum]|uniref:Uncharacterized protein n=1 Tax=Endocarpon pusillum TaxID=364733 RepID=A0A8H7ANN2_9EURO|nr:hypothetical protein GJ744_006787 [Endocarpon pusillum]